MSEGRARGVVEIVLGVCAVLLCAASVRWALRPGLFLIFDEVSARGIFLDGPYTYIVHFFPTTFYADRPLGWGFIRLLADWFGFNYERQVACLLAIHFANCGMAFWLFRKLGVATPLAIAGTALFGSLWTTAQTATYLGESFDVICLFFLLGCVLAALSERWILSSLLFFAALRSKEFAIATPVLLTVLVAMRVPWVDLRSTIIALVRRLWLHYLIAAMIGLRYAFLYREYKAQLAPDNLYRMDIHASTLMTSLAYYAALIFGEDDSRRRLSPTLLAVIFAGILFWAILRKRVGIAFGLIWFVATALPVLLMPHKRAAFWMYAPQVFLILALCLLLQEILGAVAKSPRATWAGAVCAAVACMMWCVSFDRSDYFRDRLHWIIDVRSTSMRTALGANAQLPPMGAGTHVYVSHGSEIPWLFAAGPCSYFQLVNRQRSITCVLDQPEDRLRATYSKDQGPKYFVDYHDDGSIYVEGQSSKRP